MKNLLNKVTAKLPQDWYIKIATLIIAIIILYQFYNDQNIILSTLISVFIYFPILLDWFSQTKKFQNKFWLYLINFLLVGIFIILSMNPLLKSIKATYGLPNIKKENKKIDILISTNTLESAENKEYKDPSEVIKLKLKSAKFINPPLDKNTIKNIYFMKDEDKFNELTEYEKINYLRNYINDIKDSNEKIILDKEQKDKLNSNHQYSKLISSANTLEATIKNDSIRSTKLENLLKKIIEIREEALQTGPTKYLYILLSNDYYRIGAFYDKINNPVDAFYMYCKAIDYRIKSLNYIVADIDQKSDDNKAAYVISNMYHTIGDMERIKIDTSKDNYYMALSFLLVKDDNRKKDLVTCYRGMLRQKLGILLKKDGDVYLNDAQEDYVKLLLNSNSTNLRNNTKKYLIDTCEYCIGYLRKYKHSDKLKTVKEYNEIINTFRQ